MFERLLVIGADFNALDAEGRVRASLRFAATSEVPTVGEWVLLEDADRNSCLAVVEAVEGLGVLARPEWPTWIAGDVGCLGHVFGSRTFVKYGSTGPPTEALGNQLQPA